MTRMLTTSRSALSLDRVEADRLIVALERNASVTELAAARRLVAAARRGYLPTDGAALARRCLKAEGNGTRLSFTHRAMGLIPQELREGMPQGWEHGINRIKELAERNAKRR